MASQTRSVTLSVDSYGAAFDVGQCGRWYPDHQWVITGNSASKAGEYGYDGQNCPQLILTPSTPFDIPEGARVTRFVVSGNCARVPDGGNYASFGFAPVKVPPGLRPDPLTTPILRYLAENGFGADSGVGLCVDLQNRGRYVATNSINHKFTEWMDQGLFPDGPFSIGESPHPYYLFAEPSDLLETESLSLGMSSVFVREFINAADFAVVALMARAIDVGVFGGSLTLSNLSITVHYGETGPFWQHLSAKSEEVD